MTKLAPPADTPDYMYGAWLGSLHYALGNEEILAAFRSETGNKWVPGLTSIDRMIDQSTGADRAFIEAFAEWHNANIWGAMDDPDEDVPAIAGRLDHP